MKSDIMKVVILAIFQNNYHRGYNIYIYIYIFGITLRKTGNTRLKFVPEASDKTTYKINCNHRGKIRTITYFL